VLALLIIERGFVVLIFTCFCLLLVKKAFTGTTFCLKRGTPLFFLKKSNCFYWLLRSDFLRFSSKTGLSAKVRHFACRQLFVGCQQFNVDFTLFLSAKGCHFFIWHRSADNFLQFDADLLTTRANRRFFADTFFKKSCCQQFADKR
jgi:hypothetical protein